MSGGALNEQTKCLVHYNNRHTMQQLSPKKLSKQQKNDLFDSMPGNCFLFSFLLVLL